MKGQIGHSFGHYFELYFGLYSDSIRGSTEVLPGPPKYLPHQSSYRVRLVPEIVPEIVPDPPLHSVQIILHGSCLSDVLLVGCWLGLLVCCCAWSFTNAPRHVF